MDSPLKQLMALGFTAVEIPLTQKKWAIIDIEDAPTVLEHRWCTKEEKSNKRSIFYARMTRRKPPRMRMHRFILNTPDELITDHRNHDGLDNRRKNIRICTQQQNSFNMRTRNRTGFRGVKRTGGTFQAYIAINAKQIYLGAHSTATEAAIAHDVAARKYHGEYALTNEALGKLK